MNQSQRGLHGSTPELQAAAAPHAALLRVPLLLPFGSVPFVTAVAEHLKGLAVVSFVLGMAVIEFKEALAEAGQGASEAFKDVLPVALCGLVLGCCWVSSNVFYRR